MKVQLSEKFNEISDGQRYHSYLYLLSLTVLQEHEGGDRQHFSQDPDAGGQPGDEPQGEQGHARQAGRHGRQGEGDQTAHRSQVRNIQTFSVLEY